MARIQERIGHFQKMIAPFWSPADYFGGPDLVICNSETVLAAAEAQETLAAGTLVCLFDSIERVIPIFFIFRGSKTILLIKNTLLHLISTPFRSKSRELPFILPHSRAVVQDILN